MANRPRIWWWALGALGGLLVLGSLVRFTPLLLIVIPFEQSRNERRNADEYGRHRNRYDGIVKAISATAIPQGEPMMFLISPDKDPATLKRIDFERDRGLITRSNETNLIRAMIHPNGRLTVAICTYSMGHAGVYGLYYSSGPPAPSEVENSFGVGGWTKSVGPGWWSVTDYSQ